MFAFEFIRTQVAERRMAALAVEVLENLAAGIGLGAPAGQID
jgi:hypothetical protein